MVQYIKSKLSGKYLLTTGLAISSLLTHAQDVATAAPAASTAANSTNFLWWMIFSVMAVLLLVIFLLGKVLINLAVYTVNKDKAKVVTVLLLLLLSSVTFAQDAATAGAAVSSSNPFANWNMVMAGTVLLAEMVVIAVMLTRITAMLNSLSGKKAEKKSFSLHLPKILDNLNASVAVEHEEDILTDHDYDGIRELDNDLPPWWKYGFYATIVYAFVYLFYFHVAGGPTSHDQYIAEMEKAKIEVEEYKRKNALNVDENNVQIADAGGIDEGRSIFMDNCKACHGEHGEGGVGPNLTDKYWLHGGSLNDLFKTVKYGWPSKGMKSWQTDLTGVQIKDVISYVKTLQGTNPTGAKPPQGDLYEEAGNAAVADSAASVKPDSTVTVAK